jgi:hypothetical protein
MNPGEIYAKTDEGVREIKERKLNLPIALRSVLIMIDGTRTIGEVLERTRTLRVDESAVTALERAGLIARRFSAPSVSEAAEATAPPSSDEVERFIAVQKQLSDLINKHLGVRGYLMMMRLQRAQNLRDLHDFLPDFGRALVKRIGFEPASAIVAPLERQIVGGSPP